MLTSDKKAGSGLASGAAVVAPTTKAAASGATAVTRWLGAFLAGDVGSVAACFSVAGRGVAVEAERVTKAGLVSAATVFNACAVTAAASPAELTVMPPSLLALAGAAGDADGEGSGSGGADGDEEEGEQEEEGGNN